MPGHNSVGTDKRQSEKLSILGGGTARVAAGNTTLCIGHTDTRTMHSAIQPRKAQLCFLPLASPQLVSHTWIHLPPCRTTVDTTVSWRAVAVGTAAIWSRPFSWGDRRLSWPPWHRKNPVQSDQSPSFVEGWFALIRFWHARSLFCRERSCMLSPRCCCAYHDLCFASVPQRSCC